MEQGERCFMGYFLTTSPENAVPPKSWATPKTHTPGSPVKERGHRYYVPELGRWCSRDPVGEKAGLNVNCFVLNNAIIFADINGLSIIGETPFPGGPYTGPWPAPGYPWPPPPPGPSSPPSPSGPTPGASGWEPPGTPMRSEVKTDSSRPVKRGKIVLLASQDNPDDGGRR